MNSLKGKVALVTGASRGIGRAISTKLAENGVRLAVNSSSAKGLEPLMEELTAKGAEVFLCPADLSDQTKPAEIIKSVADHFGGIDILINNAGIAVAKPLEETSVDEWNAIMAVNARAPFLLCREALPYLRKSSYATIINMSSVVGYKGYVDQGAYGASKHALMGMTKTLAQEVLKDNIRVHVIAPGGVATEMIKGMRPDIDTSDLISPEEIADIAMFILTHRGNAVIDEFNVHRHASSPWK
jgi:Dehydrogenases with different specificities (related to short-chain alcohol dehydrogenases)